MRLAYKAPETNEAVLTLASQILKLLIDSGMTYQAADDALAAAQEMLTSKTKPISI